MLKHERLNKMHHKLKNTPTKEKISQIYFYLSKETETSAIIKRPYGRLLKSRIEEPYEYIGEQNGFRAEAS